MLEQRQTEVLAQGSMDLEHVQIIKKVGGKLTDSYLEECFILEKNTAVNSPKRMENVKILIANTCTYVDGDLISTNLHSSNGH